MNLNLSSWDWLVLIIVIAGSLSFGMYMAFVKKAGKNSSNFFLGGRNVKWPIIGASIFATNIGAEHIVGLTGDSYRYGLSAGTVELTTAINLGIACAILFPYYMKNRVFTIPEFLELRYNRSLRTFFSGLMLVISVMTKLAFTLFAGALVLNSILGWNIMTTIFYVGMVVAVFTIIGGFTAVVYTDAIQTIIIIGGAAFMLAIGLDKVGGWNSLLEKAPDMMSIYKPYDDPVYPFWGIIATAFYAGIFYWGMDQVNVQRALAAPDLNNARWGAMFATLLKLLPVFLFSVTGVIAFALFPGELEGDATRQTFVLMLNKLLPTGLRGLLLASLIAALVTSLIAVLNSVSTLIVRDFIIEFRPSTSEKKQVLLGRVSIIIMTLLGISAAYLVYKNEEGLYKYLQTISAYLVIPIFPAIFFGIISKKVTLKGAVVSVIFGALLSTVFVVDQLIGPDVGKELFPVLHHKLTLNFAYRGLWAELLITGVLFLVSFFTEKTVPEKLEKTTINWSAKIEKFKGLSDWRLQLGVLSVITLLLYIWLS
ncbi:solute:Na+ symporter, SSS family [Mariniphaga anaerophila]|uniref:Solute:Na+ symporter, SSS family n=1 Tax=Mariniphaga anaerophila TaxID=1484053 RepID=A0A1M4ZYS8_9BACT|nr:sodium/solute symporter [Mariniphaga anaerophila]SHF23168.1 solute:Na+ symporter, SSS family [Mariniphaga anaerophila]